MSDNTTEQPDPDARNQTPVIETDATTESSGSNREAAKFRRQLRDTEAERDTLRATLDGMRRRAVEDIARRDHNVAKVESLWIGADDPMADMLGDDGQLDPDKTKAWITGRIDTLGLSTGRENSGAYVPSEGRTVEPWKPSASWNDFLKG